MFLASQLGSPILILSNVAILSIYITFFSNSIHFSVFSTFSFEERIKYLMIM